MGIAHHNVFVSFVPQVSLAQVFTPGLEKVRSRRKTSLEITRLSGKVNCGCHAQIAHAAWHVLRRRMRSQASQTWSTWIDSITSRGALRRWRLVPSNRVFSNATCWGP